MFARYVPLLTSGLAVLAVLPVQAQDYPARPIRVVVAFTPGGTSDIVGRLVSLKLTEGLGQQSFVDNRPGAGGTIGSEMAAKSPPDGYTLLIGHVGTLAVNPTLYPKIPYDAVRDLQPVTMISKAPSIMVVHPSVPAKTVREFIALAKSRPGQLAYGSPGSGSAGHLLMAYFTMLAKIDLIHVPYKGTAPALIDLMAGQTSTVFTGTPGILPHVQSGKLRVIGVSTAQRLPGLPGVPTIAESGLPGYDVTQWWGVLAPTGTPRPVVAKLNETLNKALQSADLRSRLAADGAEPAGSTPEEFHAFIKAEIARWAPVIKASGAKPE